MKQEELIKSCSELLYKLCDLVESRNTLNYYDINISSEYFFIPLLNQIFECNLRNLNSEEKNAPAIDLYDTGGKIAVQVTSDSSAEKIRTTLQKYRDNKLYEKYSRLVIVAIVRSHTYKADFAKDIGGSFAFSKNDDIFTIESLIKAISTLSIKRIASIQAYLEYQLETLFDQTHVLTISQSFEYISRNTNKLLNESFFEIDSETFIADFQKKLDTTDIIHISSLSAEEGKYCILNLLHKICPNKQVYIIRDKDAWDKADKFLSDCILIPEFQADEIPAIQNNITIFVHSTNHNINALKLPQRTIGFLSNKLQENGYDNPYKLLQKTHGLYYYIKFELYTGDLKHPDWENTNDKAIIVAMLLGRWTESDGDKSVIEELYGDSYEQFISYLNQYMGTDDAFVVRKRDMSYNVIFEVADPYIAVYSHKSVVHLPIIQTFLGLAKKVISDRDPIFDEPFEKHFYLSAFKKPNYSYSIKSGITCTLILLALYADYQNQITYFVKDILASISSIKDWAYVSQFIEPLCEAAPDAVVDFLENSVNNHTGLLDLFTVEKSDILTGRHYYTHILWCIEKLLLCKDYALRVVRILLELGDKIEKCSTGNNPRNNISEVFCTWYNVSALSIENKIELARIAVEKYSYFWDILYNEIYRTTSFLGSSTFTYREIDEIVPYTQRDDFEFRISYIKLLISNHRGDVERLIKLLRLLPECTDELFKVIEDELSITINNLSDYDKERIKTSLRKTIYRHRRFANSQWAASAERVLRIEKLCRSIGFNDQAYDFLYLTGPGEIPVFNPVAYDSKEDCYQKNEDVIEKVFASEMIRLKESNIDLGHFLGLRKTEPYSKIGQVIAKHYCDSVYDERILNIIISSTDNPQIAVDYVFSCSDQKLTEVYAAIEYLQNDHYADEFYVAFLLSLQFDEKSHPLVCSLPNEAAKSYWSRFSRSQIESSDLLNEVIENLLKVSNWHSLYFVMHEQVVLLNTNDILAILVNSTQKMIEEKHQINDTESYLIKQILLIVYQRIGNDFESYPVIFDLEMRLFDVLNWEDMKCCQYWFKRDVNVYADILSLIYKKDDGSFDERLGSEKLNRMYVLESEIKFCPGEDNGSINKDILNRWINEFNGRLERQGQSYLFYKKLGKLFAYSPTGTDDLFPHETIREKIEEIGNEELINSFALAIRNKRGIHNVTGGKDEYSLGQKYEKLSKEFAIRYPKTASIFNIISRNYFNESERERRIAESEIF